MTAFRWCDHRLFLQLSKYYPQFSPRFVALFFEGKYRMCFVLPRKCSRTHLITSYLRKASPCKTLLQNSYHLFVDMHRIFVSCVSVTGSTGHWLRNSMLWYLYRWCCHGIHHVFTVKINETLLIHRQKRLASSPIPWWHVREAWLYLQRGLTPLTT